MFKKRNPYAKQEKSPAQDAYNQMAREKLLSARRRVEQYQRDLAFLQAIFGLRPLSESATATKLVEEAKKTGKEILIIVAKSKTGEVEYLERLPGASLCPFKAGLVDGYIDIDKEQPSDKAGSLTTIVKGFLPFRTSIKNEVFELKKDRKKFKNKEIFKGAHDGSNDAYWTLRASLLQTIHGMKATATEPPSHLSMSADLPPMPSFIHPWRIVAIDAEGGPVLGVRRTLKQLGVATLSSSDVMDRVNGCIKPYEKWTDAITTRSLMHDCFKKFKHPFCPADDDPHFCAHENLPTERLRQEIGNIFARKAAYEFSKSPHPLPGRTAGLKVPTHSGNDEDSGETISLFVQPLKQLLFPPTSGTHQPANLQQIDSPTADTKAAAADTHTEKPTHRNLFSKPLTSLQSRMHLPHSEHRKTKPDATESKVEATNLQPLLPMRKRKEREADHVEEERPPIKEAMHKKTFGD